MRLNLFFTYFGGKWRIAKHYPVPTHHTIIEPFAGSAGFSLHYPDRKILLYDLDPKICGVWNYLINASESDILKLPTIIEDVRELSICQEAKWLIGFWLNKGMTSPCNIPGQWMRQYSAKPGHLNTYWGDGVKTRIANNIKHIRHWRIYNRSYHEIDNKDAYWFIDPPYARSGIRYKFHNINYKHLADWCLSRNGSVTVCEQDGADWLPFSFFREVKALEGKRGSKKSKEVIWIK